MLLERYLDQIATDAIQKALELDERPRALLRTTQDPKFGDYQINGAMALAKKLKKNPRELAEPIAAALLEHEAIAKTAVAGPGFVNLTLSTEWLAGQLDVMLGDTDRDGVDAVSGDAKQKVIVDYSSPNIAKQMHVGHLRSTIIGHSLVQILRFVGHDVIGDNHLGDWGTQFGLLIVGMREWGDTAALEADAIVELERVYKLAKKRTEDDEVFAEAARAELAKLQQGDADNRALWEQFVAATRKTLDVIYEQLGVSFDEWLGESAYDEMLPGVVKQLVDAGLAREDQGATCIFWKEVDGQLADKKLKKQEAPFIVQKKDGAFLYSTTDIATVLYRRDEFQADRVLYVVDHRQGLHFRQLFETAHQLGVEMKLEHVGFGTVLGEDGKPLKTRAGKLITLQSLLDEAVERAGATIADSVKSGALRVAEEDIPSVAATVGIGAVKYADLRQNRTSDYQFDFDKMISFNGNAGPYMQYAYARCKSIFRKGEINFGAVKDSGAIALDDPAELALGRLLVRFGDVVYTAAETAQPHVICEHIYDVAREFSRFYESCPVLGSEQQESRLRLTALAARQIARGLELVGIDVVEQM